MKLNSLSVSILLALSATANAAETGSVPVININQANANGISHNLYDSLNVGKEGIIFNNSQNAVDTVLAGQIAGNANLSTGTASVILNEVTSRKASTLNGMLEVAGDKAQLIIANPNGITCNSCGFINSSQVTLTTGTPDLVDGQLKGYSVNGGIITANGLSSASPTAILARAIVVKGAITAPELNVVAGNNYVDKDNNVTGTVRAVGWQQAYGIDVASLGGMYANKINLVSTENGVGVRNYGKILSGTGGIQIDSKGRLINSNAQIKSSGAINVKTNGSLENETGQIAGNGTISIDTNKNYINNSRSGKITSDTYVFVNSGQFNNTNGKVSAGSMVAINTNKAELTNSGKGNTAGITAGVVALETGNLNNNNGQITGYYVGAKTTSLSNASGAIEAQNNVEISSTGTVNNNGGLLRSADGMVRIDAANATVSNRNNRTADVTGSDALGIVAGKGGVSISAANFDNTTGQIITAGNVDILAKYTVDNANGLVYTDDGKVSIQANYLNNVSASIGGAKGVDIQTSGDVRNYLAFLASTDGDINVTARNIYNTGGVISGQNIGLTASNDINNNAGLVSATKALTASAGSTVYNTNASSFGSAYGLYLGMANQAGGLIGNGGITVTAKNLNNTNGRLVAKNGPLEVGLSNVFYNTRGLVVAGKTDEKSDSTISARAFESNYATIYSSGNLAINAGSLSLWSSGNTIDNNAQGTISADGTLTLNLGSDFTNYGWLVGKEKVSINTDGNLNNQNTIYSEKVTQVSSKKNIWNYKDIVGDSALVVNAVGQIYNTGNLYSSGYANIAAQRISNQGSKAVLGGSLGTDLNDTPVSGSGLVVGF